MRPSHAGSGRGATDVFSALADATRRDILVLLRDGELAVNTIADRFPVTRPAISQHLRVLGRAGLVGQRKEGRTRYYRACPERLSELVDFMSWFDEFWTDRLAALGRHLEKKP